MYTLEVLMYKLNILICKLSTIYMLTMGTGHQKCPVQSREALCECVLLLPGKRRYTTFPTGPYGVGDNAD